MNMQQLLDEAKQHDARKQTAPDDQRPWTYTTHWRLGEEIFRRFPGVDQKAVFLTGTLVRASSEQGAS